MESRMVRTVARLLAGALVLGALATAIPGVGVAKIVGALTGYADFGYAPEQCGVPTDYARAINGEPVRVCQDAWNTTYGFFSGHEAAPIWESEAELHISLPDVGVTFAACCDGDGTYPAFSTPAFDPVVGGNPLSGAARKAATFNGTTYAQVVETARPTATGYTLTYAITNTSTAPLKLRPLVDMTGYGYYPPAMSTAATGPRVVTMRSADAGGVVSLGESAVDGSLAPTSYTGGAYEDIWEYDDPSGPPLDNTFHPMSDEYWGYDTRVALAWPQRTLAAGETGRYSVNVGLEKAREVQLKLRGAAPVAGGSITVDASVLDERGVSGGTLRWAVYGRETREGTAVLDANGRATLTLPVLDGSSSVYAWLDRDADGELGIDEPASSGTIWATPRFTPTPTPSPTPPAPTPIPTPPGVLPGPTPTPTAPVVQPKPQPRSTVASIAFKRTYKVKGCANKTVQLQLKVGSKVLVKRNAKLNKRCQVNTTFKVDRAKLGSAKKVTVQLRFKGKTKRYSLAVPAAAQASRTASAQSSVCAESLKSGGTCSSSGAESAALCKLSAARALRGRTSRSESGSGRMEAASRCAA